jgi:transcription elongation factor GreA
MTNTHPHKDYITKDKQKALLLELEQLKTVERKAIAEKLDYARELGDLSENAEYHDAREQQSTLESRIETIENILNNAEIISKKKTSTVSLGSAVTIQKQGTKTPLTYTIVGSAEADMTNNKLSHESPLGKALIGASSGDTITLETPKGKIQYTIKKLA